MISLESKNDEGLNILARIIARDFIAKNTVNGDSKSVDKNDEHLLDQ